MLIFKSKIQIICESNRCFRWGKYLENSSIFFSFRLYSCSMISYSFFFISRKSHRMQSNLPWQCWCYVSHGVASTKSRQTTIRLSIDIHRRRWHVRRHCTGKHQHRRHQLGVSLNASQVCHMNLMRKLWTSWHLMWKIEKLSEIEHDKDNHLIFFLLLFLLFHFLSLYR